MEKSPSQLEPLELQIQALLKQKITPDGVADFLLKNLILEDLSFSDLRALCQFFLNGGFYSSLKDLLAKKIKTLQHFPWAYLTESLFQSTSLIEPEIKAALIAGAQMESALPELSQSHALDHFDDRIEAARLLRKINRKAALLKLRSDLSEQLEIHRSQGMMAQEEIVLLRLLRLFPGDTELLKSYSLLKERVALDFVSRKPQKSKIQMRPQIQKSADEIRLLSQITESQKKNLSADFLNSDYAIAHLAWDNPESALLFLEQEPETRSSLALRAELLLLAQRHLDLLELLPRFESSFANEPDALLGALLFRAQALHGLGQTYSAMEILESLIQARPDFRGAASLLAEMKESLG